MIEHTPFQVYKDYVYLKQHFKQYNFIWNEKFSYKISSESFKKRNDLHFFKKLFKQYNTRNDCIQHIISGFLYDTEIWIGDFFDDNMVSYHQTRLKTLSQINFVFERECEIIQDYCIKHDIHPKKTFLTKGIEDAIILSLPNISLESLVIFNQFNNWASLWFPINSFQKQRRLLLHKYTSILSFEKCQYEKLKNTYQELLLN